MFSRGFGAQLGAEPPAKTPPPLPPNKFLTKDHIFSYIFFNTKIISNISNLLLYPPQI